MMLRKCSKHHTSVCSYEFNQKSIGSVGRREGSVGKYRHPFANYLFCVQIWMHSFMRGRSNETHLPCPLHLFRNPLAVKTIAIFRSYKNNTTCAHGTYNAKYCEKESPRKWAKTKISRQNTREAVLHTHTARYRALYDDVITKFNLQYFSIKC